MTDLIVTMNTSGSFTLSSDVGRIEEYCRKRLKIKLNSDFLTSAIKYYTLSFEPYSLSRKIITENIYRDSSQAEGIYFADGYIFCPVYDYIAVSPAVLVQVDAYETDDQGNVTAIIKSGIFTLEFAPSLTGEGVMLQTVRPDVKFFENVENAVNQVMETRTIDGAQIEDSSITGRKIKIAAISNAHLQTNSVTASKIQPGSIVTQALTDAVITTDKLRNSSVTEPKIADSAVTTDKICDKSITAAKIADGTIANTKLANYCVSETKLRPLSVSTTKIAAKAVTPAKLDRTYLTEHQSLEGYATENWVKSQNYLKEHVSLDGYATEDWVKEQKYLTEHQSLDGYATEGWVEEQKYLTEHQSLDGYATEDWVEEQKYLTEHQSLDGYATEEWVEEQGFLTASDDFLTQEDMPRSLSELENDVAVSFLSQSLTATQKSTACENIGAVKAEDGKTLSQNDFTDADKEKLDNALTEHQDISMKADISSLAAVSFSGSYNDLSDLPEDCSFTDELRLNYDNAYSHSLSPHAPSDAEKNIIESVSVNGKTAEIENKNVSLTVIDYTVREKVFMEVY